MEEREFLKQLEQRAREQELLIKRVPLSGIFVKLSLWFGRHPWRIIIPFSIIATMLLRMFLGRGYYEFILWIFGGI